MRAFCLMVDGPFDGTRIPAATRKIRQTDHEVPVELPDGRIAIYAWDRTSLVYRFCKYNGADIPHRLD